MWLLVTKYGSETWIIGGSVILPDVVVVRPSSLTPKVIRVLSCIWLNRNSINNFKMATIFLKYDLIMHPLEVVPQQNWGCSVSIYGAINDEPFRKLIKCAYWPFKQFRGSQDFHLSAIFARLTHEFNIVICRLALGIA